MSTVLLTIVAILLVGMAIPQLLARSVLGPVFRLFVVPGVILHELAHVVFCVMTGARIRRIRFFKRDGGDVAHEQSKIPLLGPLLITFAPLVIGFVVLIALAKRLLPHLDDQVLLSHATSIRDFPIFLSYVIRSVHWTSLETWVLLYLILSIGATMTPSFRDLRNSALPLFIMIIALALVLRTGRFIGPLTDIGVRALPELTIALFILMAIAAVALVIYTVGTIFGIT